MTRGSPMRHWWIVLTILCSLVSLCCQLIISLNPWVFIECQVKITIKLCGCTSWSVSSLGTHQKEHFHRLQLLWFIMWEVFTVQQQIKGENSYRLTALILLLLQQLGVRILLLPICCVVFFNLIFFIDSCEMTSPIFWENFEKYFF